MEITVKDLELKKEQLQEKLKGLDSIEMDLWDKGRTKLQIGGIDTIIKFYPVMDHYIDQAKKEEFIKYCIEEPVFGDSLYGANSTAAVIELMYAIKSSKVDAEKVLLKQKHSAYSEGVVVTETAYYLKNGPAEVRKALPKSSKAYEPHLKKYEEPGFRYDGSESKSSSSKEPVSSK